MKPNDSLSMLGESRGCIEVQELLSAGKLVKL